MIVEVINTGTELLLGEVTNTHLSFIGRELLPTGLRLARQVAVPDGDAIREALQETFGRADIVIITGGLGPTSDDITREITAELLGATLIHDEQVWQRAIARFARRGVFPSDNVRREAMRPEHAVVLLNDHGTAPGLYFPATDGKPHLFLLPGPPRELKPMFSAQVVPILQKLYVVPVPQIMSVQRIIGVGESAVAELVSDALLKLGIEVGYCCRPGEVDVRLIGDAARVEQAVAIVREKLGEAVFGIDKQRLEEIVVSKLIATNHTLTTAESCTGGILADRITNVPGASQVYLAGFVTYSNASKTDAIGVSADLVEEHGAVSEPVAIAMAEGACAKSGADFALSTTGIAGPGGGTLEKPVGLVFMALAQRGQVTAVWKFSFTGDRETFKRMATNTALDLLRRRLEAL